MATGYVVNKDGIVTVIVPDLIEIDGDTMKGENLSLNGVNLEIADIVAVETSLELKIGDRFPGGQTNVVDKYAKKDPRVEIQNDIAALLIENAVDKQKVAFLEGMVGNLLIDISTLKGDQ